MLGLRVSYDMDVLEPNVGNQEFKKSKQNAS